MKKVKKLKGISQETRKVFAESAVLVMLENIHDDIKFIAEGHSGLVNSIEEIKTDLSEFKEDTAKKFKTVFEYFSRIDDELIDINAKITEISRKIDQKADKAWVLEKIKILEQQLFSVKDKAEKEYR